MSTEGEFYLPDDAVLRELGRVALLHSHLDHTLRLTIKRALGISIDDPGYWKQTHFMTKDLRDRTRDLINERYDADPDRADVLNKLLDDAEELTKHRNRVLHSVWVRIPGQEPVLHDRDIQTKQHNNYIPPTVEELVQLGRRIRDAQQILNVLTR